MELNAVYDSKIPAENFRKLTQEERETHQYNVELNLKFLIGAATSKLIGGPGKVDEILVDWDHPFTKSGRIHFNYTYKGLYSVVKNFQEKLYLPLPYHAEDLNTPEWRKCSDDPKVLIGFLWYHWDIDLPGCDHQENIQYQMVELKLSNPTPQTTNTFPEYKRMIRQTKQGKELNMTFAFGYFGPSPENANPDTDTDPLAFQYRYFVDYLDKSLSGFQKTPIYRGAYNFDPADKHLLGYQWKGQKNDINVHIKVVVEAGIPQLYLFAKSYAEDHDSFFGWFGHSLLGTGFDNARLQNIIKTHKDTYSVSPDYQLIYWDSCNSYTYYADQVFESKRAVNSADLNGTQGADVLSNVLPSYIPRAFDHAKIMFESLWEAQASYQQIMDRFKLPHPALKDSALVLQGDEDNL